MNTYDTISFDDLVAASSDEVITHSLVSDIRLASGKRLGLITLDNGRDHTRPNTLGPNTLQQLGATLDELRARAARGEIHGIAITGKPYILAAGADLSKVSTLNSADFALKMAQFGHYVLAKLHGAGVPTFAFINGLALGGGTEIALNADYRTIDASIPAIALPEVFLGLIPGWGGATLLPNLIGIENALKVIIENPLKNNRMLKGPQAFELGMADAMFSPVNFLEDSFAWADGVLNGAIQVKRQHSPGKIERLAKWDIAISVARKQLEASIGNVAKAPYVALDLLKAAKDNNVSKGFLREDAALAELIAGDQFHASIYAFNLVQKRAKRPAGAPEANLAEPVTKVGVIGAGLMASQFALLFLRRLRVPVVITDLDQERVDRGLAYIGEQIDALAAKKRITADERTRLLALVSGTTDMAEFANCDWVIEAVFEELSVKQAVFSEIERHIAPTAILATNTSSLSVAQIAAPLQHPERVVGFHFFNPVAVMPLVEVVRAPQTTDKALATAMAVAKELKKTAVITADTPGFVVNRLLARLLGEAMFALDSGTPFADAEHALDSFGLPMNPFVLLELVGLNVGAHVLDAHHAAFPSRFYRSENLHRIAEHGTLLARDKKGNPAGLDPVAAQIISTGGVSQWSAEPTIPTTARTGNLLLERVQFGLADEIQRMLDEGVVHGVEDIDLCMIMGAGWPFHLGGITPYLDRTGVSEATNGKTFHTPQIRGVHS